jgi:thiol:disulfide interchange protein
MRRSTWPARAAVLLTALLLVACGARTAAETEPSPGPARGVAFAKLGYDAALDRARTERKLVMVDVYTDWCGWCRKLDREVFADEQVAAAAKGVVAVRLDAEKEGEKLAERFGVDGFPTVLFLDADGKLVKRVNGYVDRDEMLEVLKSLPGPGV